MLAALILAAGASRRMGAPKALLRDADGRTFVARLVRSFLAAGVEDIVVVTGDAHDSIVAALEADGPSARPRIARNEDPSRGQLSSLWVGLDAVAHPALSGILVTPVDVPLVAAATIGQVVEAWSRRRAPVVRPAMGDRHGHPVLFDCSVFEELRGASLGSGAKTVVRAHANEVVDVPVEDTGCLVDVDTRTDYERLFGVRWEPGVTERVR